MKRVFLVVFTLLVALLSWAQVSGSRVAVVLSVQGGATCHKADDIASRHTPLHLLDSITLGDTLILKANSQVTLSLLSTGIRYQLSGPLQLTVTSKTSLPAAQGISELGKQAGREGLVASQGIELSKFGGASSRQHAYPVYVDEPSLTLDLGVLRAAFESSPLQVFYRLDEEFNPWIPLEASLIHQSDSRDLLRLSTVKLVENKTYLIYIGSKTDPAEREPQFRVVRLPASALSGIRVLEESATDLPGQIELYQGYMALHLFEKAEKLLSRLQQEFPDQADWPRLWADFKKDRQIEPE